MDWVYYLFYLQLGIVVITLVGISLKHFLPKYDGEIEEFHNNALATVTILGGIFFVLAIAAKVIEVMK